MKSARFEKWRVRLCIWLVMTYWGERFSSLYFKLNLARNLFVEITLCKEPLCSWCFWKRSLACFVFEQHDARTNLQHNLPLFWISRERKPFFFCSFERLPALREGFDPWTSKIGSSIRLYRVYVHRTTRCLTLNVKTKKSKLCFEKMFIQLFLSFAI